MRLGERLHITWEIAPDSLPARVPGLLLQPLVENAIRHAIAPSTRGGTLLISTRRDGDSLVLQVRDSGPGLPAVSQIPHHPGVGLANIRNRLQRLHGDRQQLELVNDHGLVVNVRLPFAVELTSPSHAS